MSENEDRDVTEFTQDQVDRLLEGSVALAAIAEKLDNRDVTQTIALILRLITKPDIPANIATPYIVKLAACAAEFKLTAKLYATEWKGKDDARVMKEMYFTLSEHAGEVAQALKYVTRNY